MPSTSSATCLLARALLGLLIVLGACGDDRLAIVVQVDGVTPQVSALEVTATLNNKLATDAVLRITDHLSEFVIYLPAQSEGTLKLAIGAQPSPSACHVARAQVSTVVHPAPPRVVQVTAVLQPASPALCPLTIDIAGDGAVRAASGELVCNKSQCVGVFPQNAAVELTAVPGARASSQVVWAPFCPTAGPSCMVQVAQSLKLSAAFSALPCSPDGWCQHNAQVGNNNLRAVWSNGPSDVWVVGTSSVVVHYDGKMWTSVAAVTGTNYTFYGVASTGPSDVVIGGSVTAGASTTGVIFSFDGSKWSQSAAPAKTVRDVLTGSATSGRAVGDAGLLYSRSGSMWAGNEMTMPMYVYWSAWSTGVAEYLVGTMGYIGVAAPGSTSAQRLASGLTSATLMALWGTGDKDIWAVGDAGTMVHYDGTWTMPSAPVTANLLSGVWGRAPNDYWAVGDSATLLHYNGTTWSPQSGSSGADKYQAVGGSAAGDVWIVGDSGIILQHKP